MNLLPIHSASVTRATANAGSLADLPIEQLAGNKHLTEQEKVQQASRQFEAIVLRQILSEARKSVIHSSFDGQSSTSGIYEDMVTSQLADSISRSGSFGLARSLEAQLVHQAVDPSAHPSGAHSPPASVGKPVENIVHDRTP